MCTRSLRCRASQASVSAIRANAATMALRTATRARSAFDPVTRTRPTQTGSTGQVGRYGVPFLLYFPTVGRREFGVQRPQPGAQEPAALGVQHLEFALLDHLAADQGQRREMGVRSAQQRVQVC